MSNTILSGAELRIKAEQEAARLQSLLATSYDPLACHDQSVIVTDLARRLVRAAKAAEARPYGFPGEYWDTLQIVKRAILKYWILTDDPNA